MNNLPLSVVSLQPFDLPFDNCRKALRRLSKGLTTIVKRPYDNYRKTISRATKSEYIPAKANKLASILKLFR